MMVGSYRQFRSDLDPNPKSKSRSDPMSVESPPSILLFAGSPVVHAAVPRVHLPAGHGLPVLRRVHRVRPVHGRH